MINGILGGLKDNEEFSGAFQGYFMGQHVRLRNSRHLRAV